MPDERVVELVHRRIDGEITPADAQELTDARRRDDEVDAFFLEMCAICDALDSLRLAEPPPRLAALVATRIRAEREPVRPPIPFPPQPGARRMRVALALSATALLAAIALTPLLLRWSDSANMAGSMTAPASASTKRFDETAVSAGGVSGTVAAEESGNEVRVVCRLAASVEGEIAVEYDPRALRLVVAAGVREAAAEEGRRLATLRAPPWTGARFVFARLTDGESSVKVTVNVGGSEDAVALRIGRSDD